MLTADLGSRYEVMRTNIKKWCVGSPIQAALDALGHLIETHGLRAAEIKSLTAHMPDDRLHIVDNRDIPDISLQHLLAVMLIDGTLTFQSSHEEERMHDPAVLAMRARIRAVPSAELTVARPARQAIIVVETLDGRVLERRTFAVLGTPDNPMSQQEVEAKADDLMAPVIGAERSRLLIEQLRHPEAIADMGSLRALLSA
jgi:2-methylcitrate dehydratase PrpD